MKKVFNIILLLIWIIVIYVLSNDNGIQSTGKSDQVVHLVKNTINIQNEDSLTLIIRKLAHFTEYLILGLLIINVLKDYFKITIKLVLFSILFAFIYALSDEFHQLFIKSRNGNILDVLIDTFGSTIGVSIFFIKYKIAIKKKL